MSNQKKSSNITFNYSLVQACFWMGFACLSSFSSVYMLGLGISNTVIGITMSLGALLSALASPFVGMLIDGGKKVTTKMVLMISSICIAILALLLYPAANNVPVIIPILYIVLIWMLMLSQPFANSIGVAAINAGYTLHFGPARAIGSLAYAIIAYILGKATEAYSSNVVPLFVAVAFFLSIISLLIYPLKEKSPVKSSASADESVNKSLESAVEKPSIKSFFRKYNTFGIMIIGLIFIYLSHVIINSFNMQIITTKGGNSSNMGTAAAISAGLEIVPMFLFPIIIKKFRLSSLLKLSAVFFTLKVLVTLMAPNVTTYYAVQSFQMLGWGIMAVAIVYYVNELVDITDTAQGQAFAGMSLTIGNVLANLLGGRIIDSFGITVLLITGLVAAVIGTVIFWIGVNLSDKKMINKPV